MKKSKTEPQKKRINKMDVFLIIIFVTLAVFTITMIRTFHLYGSIPDTLCMCVFGVLGGECGAMAWIKTTQERRREREYELEDRKHYEAHEQSAEREAEQETEEYL